MPECEHDLADEEPTPEKVPPSLFESPDTSSTLRRRWLFVSSPTDKHIAQRRKLVKNEQDVSNKDYRRHGGSMRGGSGGISGGGSGGAVGRRSISPGDGIGSAGSAVTGHGGNLKDSRLDGTQNSAPKKEEDISSERDIGGESASNNQKYEVDREFWKHFKNKGNFEGEIKKFDSDSGYYKIHYKDGDEEELSENELTEVLEEEAKVLEEEESKTTVLRSGRRTTAVNYREE